MKVNTEQEQPSVQEEKDRVAMTALAIEAETERVENHSVSEQDNATADEAETAPAADGKNAKKSVRQYARQLRSFALPVALSLLLIFAVVFMCRGHVELMLYDGDNPLGTVEHLNVLEDSRRAAASALYQKTGMAVALSDQIRVRYVMQFSDTSHLTVDELKNYLVARCENNLFEGYVLSIDQTDIAACEREEEILQVLERLKTELTQEVVAVNGDVSSVEISTPYSITYKFCDAALRTDADALYEKIRPDVEVKTQLAREAKNLVPDGTEDGEASPEEIWDMLCASYESASSSLARGVRTLLWGSKTQDIMTEETELGQYIHLSYSICILRTVENVIPYRTVPTADETQYPFYYRITQEGQNGIHTTVYRDLYINGELYSVEIDSEEDSVPAVDCIEVYGTKAYPAAGEVTGHFIFPLDAESFIITSYFAERRPEFDGSGSHLGIDIVEERGTPVYAADGGVVSWAGSGSSYGNMVRIDHADGLQTVYAHLNSITVEDGQEVYQGQLIGYVGMTGNTSGYHLHFEVREYGVQKDPIAYLDPIPLKW